MQENLTPEQKQESEARMQQFRERYGALSKELQVDFMAFPQFVPAGPTLFGVSAPLILVDKKYMPVESPFNKKDDEPVIKA